MHRNEHFYISNGPHYYHYLGERGGVVKRNLEIFGNQEVPGDLLKEIPAKQESEKLE